jgi:RNA polymerase sigma-70 factor (ECF subfamily)
MSPDPETELVKACQQAIPSALDGHFKELYDRYKDRIYNICYRISGNPTDALDASQETFGILFRRIGEFKFKSRFSSWVYRIAVNASIDLRRRNRSRRWVSLERMADSDEESSNRLDIADTEVEMPMQAATRHELESEVQKSMNRLSEKLCSILVLRYMQGLSYDEIAETLEISLGTVKSRLSRAHEALNRELTPVLDRHYLGKP